MFMNSTRWVKTVVAAGLSVAFLAAIPSTGSAKNQTTEPPMIDVLPPATSTGSALTVTSKKTTKHIRHAKTASSLSTKKLTSAKKLASSKKSISPKKTLHTKHHKHKKTTVVAR